MGLPVVFLIGLLVVFATRELMPAIPGSADALRLSASALLLAVPSLLVLASRRASQKGLSRGRQNGRIANLLLRLSRSATPIAVFVVSTYGGWDDYTWLWSGDSNLVSLILAVLPLLLAELPRLVLATQAVAWMDVASSAGPLRPSLPEMSELLPAVRLQIGWILLLSLPWLMLGLGLDLLSLHRATLTFVLGTSLGLTASFLLFLVAAAMVLPWWFRLAFGTTSELPEPVGTALRETASRLGFAPSRVLLLPTGMTAVNAMMVGPLPVSRCLCVTDGLLSVLDDEALTGVVAHEVGHARMSHPGLLMLLAVVLPLLLMQSLSSLPLDELGLFAQGAAGLAAVFAAWSVVRTLAQRFELEADVASVRALGAGPCSRALLSVTSMVGSPERRRFGRLLSLHPEESIRLATMMRYEKDAAFRQRFDATGRKVRLSIFASVAAALALAVWTWIADWPYEHAIWRFHSGDVVAAKQLTASLGTEVPPRWQEVWGLLTGELAAADEVAPDAHDWATASAAFDRRCFARGVEVLRQSGPAAARPWFALAVDSGTSDRLLRRQLYEFCRAVQDGDVPRFTAIREAIKRREIPIELAAVFE